MEAFQAGRWPRARELAAQALALAPGNYDALQLLALSSLNEGRAADALPHCESLLARFPDDAFAHNTRGAVLQVLGRLAESADAYRKSVALAPQNLMAWLNLAQVSTGLGRHEEAAASLAKVIDGGERQPQFYAMRASALLAAGQAGPAALEAAREAVRLAPGLPDALEVAARAELEAGSVAAAIERYRSLETLAPPAGRWRFRRALAWPPVAESREQVAEHRAATERALDELSERPAPLADPLREVGLTGFYMAYQGFDDTALQARIARAFLAASPDLAWAAPHVARPRDRGRRIRLGILSRHLNNHTIGKLNIGIAQKLDRARFEVVVLRPPCAPDFLSGAFDECAASAVTLPMDLPAARQRVAEAELDALFYPDIGMDPFTYFLAFARLARLQFTTWGHPVTTGIPNMDCFVSARHAEPGGAERFYGERLVRFENPPSYYYRPRDPSAFDVRAHLGLAAGTRLYASLQTLYKMHPDFDRALVDILRRDPDGRVLLVAARQEGWNERLRRRLAREGPDVADRIVFMPPVLLPDYLAVLRDADALLDTFHFGGGNSSYESFGMSAPVVTLPAERMRGRVTAALYAKMGVPRWIAGSPQRFVELALELAGGDAARKRAWREEIGEGASRFLEDDAVVREFEAFVESSLA